MVDPASDVMQMPDRAGQRSVNCRGTHNVFGSSRKKSSLKSLSARQLKAVLCGRPDVLRLVLSLRRLVEKKKNLVVKLKAKVKTLKNKSVKVCKDTSCQTESVLTSEESVPVEAGEESVVDAGAGTEVAVGAGWMEGEGLQKSIAEQVEEAAQSALAQTGMVYVESAGMYYDYKSGYYYNSELGLYYHSSTGCYYYYSEEKNEFTYHSHADTSAHTQAHTQAHHSAAAAGPAAVTVPAALPPETQQLLRKKQKLRKLKKEHQEDDKGPTEAKRKKKEKRGQGDDKIEDKQTELESENVNNSIENLNGTKENLTGSKENVNIIHSDEKSKINDILSKDVDIEMSIETQSVAKETDNNKEEADKTDTEKTGEPQAKEEEIEDGECSDTASEDNAHSVDDANADSEADVRSVDGSDSDSTNTDVDESVARHHPPCMRIVVRETRLPKLKVGSLFMVTKDGGTLGREGEEHSVIIRDENVSRIHLQFLYDDKERCYKAIDLGSKNGTILNGTRMSESQEVSQPMEVVHGSTLQVGETKLLCHVHPGADTCGHCEPGLLMAAGEAAGRAAYTRNCSVKKQHALELARLRNRYAPEPLAIEDGAYNDRAKARRDQVGSTHDAEKTQQSDLATGLEADNKGFQLLAKMGWKKGEGLGKEQQGQKDPVPLVSNEGTAGLGAGGAGAPRVMPAMRLSARARARPLRPAASAFRDPLEEDD